MIIKKTLFDPAKFLNIMWYFKKHLKNMTVNGLFKYYSGKRCYSCKVCKVIFFTRSALLFHKKSHSGLKLFSCDNCWKSFLDVYELAKHIRIHASERPYSCYICDKIFTFRSALALYKIFFSSGINTFSYNDYCNIHLYIYLVMFFFLLVIFV